MEAEGKEEGGEEERQIGGIEKGLEMELKEEVWGMQRFQLNTSS